MLTRRGWVKSILCLLFSSNLYADSFEIKKENRIPNGPNGRCAWSSLETLARHRGIKKLEGLAEAYSQGDGSATPEQVFQECQKRGVPCHSWRNGSVERIKEACDKKLGAIAGVRELWGGRHDLHAILVTGYDKDYVYYVDTNDVEWYFRATWSWWMHHWTGWLVILP